MRSRQVSSLLLSSILAVPAVAEEPMDLGVLQRIRDEGFNRSRVMDTLSYLTDVIGPRLTGSPQMKRANDWTRAELERFGLQQAHLEAWGPFGLGWSLEHVSVHMLEPEAAPLIAWPKAWTPGTDGVVRGGAVFVKLESEADLEAARGKLKGKIALISAPSELKGLDAPLLKRLDEKELEEEARFQVSGRGAERIARFRARRKFQAALHKFLVEEQPLCTIEGSDRWPGVVRVQSGGSREKDEPRGVPMLVLAAEHYNRLARLLARPMEVELELDVRVSFHDQDPLAYNTLAEIPGSDPRKEVVLMGAHLDSWHAGTGSNDNGAGSAVVMEAGRILASLGQKPKRTIRVGLWSGEEQGLLGSRAYVAQHYATRPDATDDEPDKGELKLKPEHKQLAGYFNIDAGAGRVRGVYLQENVAARPIFQAWIEPLADLGVSTITNNRDFSTDHVPFDWAGLPAFNMMQDGLDYESLTHHTHLDTFDHAKREDLMQASVVMAWLAWQAANRPEPLPRKPLR